MRQRHARLSPIKYAMSRTGKGGRASSRRLRCIIPRHGLSAGTAAARRHTREQADARHRARRRWPYRRGVPQRDWHQPAVDAVVAVHRSGRLRSRASPDVWRRRRRDRCWLASWGTACVSTSSAAHRRRRRLPASRSTAKCRRCGSTSRSRRRAGARRARRCRLCGFRSSGASRLSRARVRVRETVENLSPIDRPVGWTQHVTLGPPFLRAAHDRVPRVRRGVPRSSGAVRSVRLPPARARSSSGRCAPRAGGGDGGSPRLHRRSPLERLYGAPHARGIEHAFFVAFSPRARLAFGYIWRRADFPWLGIWEENASRPQPPWNGQTLTRGMEFGVSPFPETRREMIERRRLFEVPTFRWIPAASRVSVEYWILASAAEAVPETLVLAAS